MTGGFDVGLGGGLRCHTVNYTTLDGAWENGFLMDIFWFAPVDEDTGLGEVEDFDARWSNTSGVEADDS